MKAWLITKSDMHDPMDGCGDWKALYDNKTAALSAFSAIKSDRNATYYLICLDFTLMTFKEVDYK